MSTAIDQIEAPPGRFLKRQDLARIFNVTPATIRLWELDGRIPKPIRLGRKPVWAPSTIKQFLDSLQPSERRGA